MTKDNARHSMGLQLCWKRFDAIGNSVLPSIYHTTMAHSHLSSCWASSLLFFQRRMAPSLLPKCWEFISNKRQWQKTLREVGGGLPLLARLSAVGNSIFPSTHHMTMAQSVLSSCWAASLPCVQRPMAPSLLPICWASISNKMQNQKTLRDI